MEPIHTETLFFHPDQSKTNFRLPIQVKKDYKGLFFTCHYAPKNVDDMALAEHEISKGIERYIPTQYRAVRGNWREYLPLMNFITLSIDRRDEYIGCAHRHAPTQTHLISDLYSSPGFFRQPASAGKWAAIFNIHAVISPTVTYHFEVFGIEESEELHELLSTL